MSDEFDVVVVGGGHAGIEACLAVARMGGRVALLTISQQGIGRMSCNPAIGGIAKGQLVREIDALGGQMGLTADATGIHFHLLNTSKGPAMRSPRCQSDKYAYADMMQTVIEEAGVSVVEGMAEGFELGDGAIASVRVSGGRRLKTSKVVITTGTFMNGLIHRGKTLTPAGRIDEPPSVDLPAYLRSLGLETRRLKTGTPPRVKGSTIDRSVLDEHAGDVNPTSFSFRGAGAAGNKIQCHIAWTTEATHRVILDNRERIPLYNGQIEGIGPRYCPSIEDKVCRFSERERHQVFIEPESLRTDEVYLNGISTSMEEALQLEILKSIRGLEKAEVIRFGYAIEYDFVPPHQLRETMETLKVPGLYLAGQINGTTGYEEAAAQGLMAGINAMLALRGEAPFVLGREEAYVGVLLDDLVVKEIHEPYRMFTSRAEYRLLLRHDNADWRLMDHGFRLGLITGQDRDKMRTKYDLAQKTKLELAKTKQSGGKSFLELLRQPEISLDKLRALPDAPGCLSQLSAEVDTALEVEVKYEGYLAREHRRIGRMQKADQMKLPECIDYLALEEMRVEGREKLSRFRPSTMGQASRIAGVNPADLQILEVYMRRGHWPVLAQR
jgi:tRNA uridine 5-carboxymethylaminomethyl modification enzyme